MDKNICILTSVHPVFDTRIFYKQAKTLAKAGYEVTLIAQHERDEVVDGVKIVALPKPRSRFWRMVGTWRVFRLALRQKADVYHFHDPELLPVGLLLKLMTKGKVIYDVHEDYRGTILTKHWLALPLRKPVAQLFNSLEKWAASRLDYTIAATDDISAKFASIGRVTAIRNYPTLGVIEANVRHVAGEPTLVYAGGLTQTRGISEIVQAMAHLNSARKAKLVLYGKFEPAGYQEVVQALRGSDRVEYQGWVKPEELWQKLAQASIGIVCLHHVSQYTVALPTKLFEYMAVGLPVIASNFPLWKEIVEGNNCGLTVNPLDPEEIARAIEYLLDHPEESREMGENGRRAVAEKYNWEKESQRLLALYQELLSNGTGSNV